MNNHYAMLGVLPNASVDEIKASYRQLVKRFHPDMPGGNARFFARIQEAYEILSEPKLRRSYDQSMHRPYGSAANGTRAQPGTAPDPRPGARTRSRPNGAWRAGAQGTGRPRSGTNGTNGTGRPQGGANGPGTQRPGTHGRNGAGAKFTAHQGTAGTGPEKQESAQARGNGGKNGRRGFAAGIREAIRTRTKSHNAPLAMLTRVMSIAVARSGRFQLQGLIGNIEVNATTPETLWASTLKKFGSQNPEHLARHVIQIKLSGERDLVKTMMPRPTDFGVEFQQDSPDVQKNKLRNFIDNLMSNGPLGGLFTRSPFGLYGAFLPLTLQITVPKGLALYLRDVTGTIQLGELEGDVTAKVLGGVIKADRVGNLNITLNGGSRAFIKHVSGNADLMGFGTSRLYLGGEIARMRAVLDNDARAEIKAPIGSMLSEINGRAVLDARGPVGEAYISVEDQGYARLASVGSPFQGERKGQGRIDVLHRRRNLSARA